jgi:hypothetical protein
MKYLPVFLIIFIVFPVYASSSISLSNGQSDLTPDQELLVNISINISQNKDYFLRGEFHKAGSTNYCGYTWNGTGWYNGPFTTNNGWLNLLKVTVVSSSWSGILKSKIDPSDPGCRENGIYNFRVQRYTEAGSAGDDDQNEISVNMIFPSPTPTTIPTEKPVPTVMPSPIPTPVPTGKPLNTPLPASPLLYSPTPVLIVSEVTKTPDDKSNNPGTVSALLANSGDVLGKTQINHSLSDNSGDSKILGITLAFIGAGLALLTFVLVYQKVKQNSDHGELPANNHRKVRRKWEML